MIQVLTYSGNEKSLEGNNIIVNSLHDAKSLDEFCINIIDLSSEYLWRYDGDTQSSINSINDIKSISIMINNSRNSEIVIVLPQNLVFEFRKWNNKYQEKIELKNMISSMSRSILSELYKPIVGLDIVYENTSTEINGKRLEASFYFNNISENVFTKSIKSNKATTVGIENLIISTLKLSTDEEISAFLKKIGLIQDKAKTPEWMEEIEMFDDGKQIDIIRENQTRIQEAESNIAIAKKKIDKNNEYKSILYTNGDELVKVVFEILEDMLGCNFSEFRDVKKEDFLVTIEEYTFIGEIKGVTHNVKSENVAQLDRHFQGYLDDNPEMDETKLCALLIINHQRSRPLSDREPVHERQIALAKRNGSLIIESYTLLKLFEKYLSKEKTREQCVDILKNNIGLLKI